MSDSETLAAFLDSTPAGTRLRVEDDLGDGFVRLRVSEAERRQAKQDIRCVEDAVIEMLRNARDAHARTIIMGTSRSGDARRIIVADDGDGAVRVIRGDLSERFGRTARHLCIGLRAVKREAVRFKYELMQLFRALIFKVPEELRLPRPHMYLAQTCVKLHRDAVPARYRRGGHACAVKVA